MNATNYYTVIARGLKPRYFFFDATTRDHALGYARDTAECTRGRIAVFSDDGSGHPEIGQPDPSVGLEVVS